MGAKSAAAMVAVTGALTVCVLWGNWDRKETRQFVTQCEERLALSCACEIMESTLVLLS